MRFEKTDEIRRELLAMTREMGEQAKWNYRMSCCVERRMKAPMQDPRYLKAAASLEGVLDAPAKKILPLLALGSAMGVDAGREMSGFLKRMLPYITIYDAEELAANPYFQKIRMSKVQEGAFRFEETPFLDGEIFFDREPASAGYSRINTLGVFNGTISYPAFYEGERCWMSITPNETVTMEEPVRQARGRVLTLGLGLGYYAYMVHLKDEVESVTIVEREPEVIDCFARMLLPQFDHPEKIRIIQADAIEFLKELIDSSCTYDYMFADIWQNPVNGMEAYLVLKAQEHRFKKMACDYWIEESFIGCLEESLALLLQYEFLGEDDASLIREKPGYAFLKNRLQDHLVKTPQDIRRMFGGGFLKGESGGVRGRN